MTLLEAARFVLSWWGFTLLAALAAWPLVFLCLRRLPDRGFAFARIFGVLVVGYLFWLGCWLRLWTNSAGAVWIVLLAVFAAGAALAWRRGESPWAWLRTHWKEALFTEILFLSVFAVWAFVRANNPTSDAAGGEKRMELAFLNSILRSTYFPPNDPWLSGYAISYYHFGYILTAMIAKATGVAGAIAHNLGSALWFGMTAVGSFGLLRNLLMLRARAKADPAAAPVSAGQAGASPWRKAPSVRRNPSYLFVSLLAPFTLLVVGNLEGFLEVLHADGVGWQDGRGQIWQQIGITNLTDPPAKPLKLEPTRFIWWWQASRVVTDHDLSGASFEIIDEFPAFSFLLGDLHPHVLALPFFLAALAVILEMLLRRGGAAEADGLERWLFLIFLALSIGSLVFLNTWDILLFGLAAIAGWVGWRWSGRPLLFGPVSGWKAYLLRWFVTGILALGLFIPFFIGFQSQAGGLIPNILFPTRGAQFLVMFLPLLVPILAWMILELAAGRWRLEWRNSLMMTVGGLFVLIIASAAMAIIGAMLYPDLISQIAGGFGGFPMTKAIVIVLGHRIADPVATMVPLTIITMALVIILGGLKPAQPKVRASAAETQDAATDGRLTTIFVILLATWGALLTLFPEYFYLRDLFGYRINTIFKFYFPAWTVWSMAAAFGLIGLVDAAFDGRRFTPGVRSFAIIGGILSAAGLILGAVYLPLALKTKTDNFDPYGGRTLDSSAFLEWALPGDDAAIAWLNAHITDNGPIAEAMPLDGKGWGDYTDFDRIATFTGIPGVLGWGFHEDQWRGSMREVGSRQTDLETLFRTPNWETAQQILDAYGIRYVYFGPLETQTYGTLGLKKFVDNLNTLYQDETAIIFERRAP